MVTLVFVIAALMAGWSIATGLKRSAFVGGLARTAFVALGTAWTAHALSLSLHPLLLTAAVVAGFCWRMLTPPTNEDICTVAERIARQSNRQKPRAKLLPLKPLDIYLEHHWDDTELSFDIWGLAKAEKPSDPKNFLEITIKCWLQDQDLNYDPNVAAPLLDALAMGQRLRRRSVSV